jgi:hypothetical protein
MAAEAFDDNDADYVVGYRRPPLHTRFKPGQSGNPSGRPKGSPNLKTILEQVLKEQISLREGTVTKKITKAEAIIRGLVIGAMKSDARSQATLFRLVEQIGQFEEKPEPLQRIERVIVSWAPPDEPTDPPLDRLVPAISQIKRD